MVFRRKDRPDEGFRIWVTLPAPWGRVGPWQTGIHDKRQAERVQAWLYEQAMIDPRLIDGLLAKPKRYTLRDAWVAYRRGTLEQLLAGISDPLLVDAVAAYRPECEDARERSGLDQLVEYSDAGVRLSWLTGNAIKKVYRTALDAGRKPNSVRRSLHRAVVGLLGHHLGEDGRRAALRGVTAPGGKDERLVRVSAEEIRTLVNAAGEADFRWLVVAAIATAVDQGPLLAMTPRDLLESDRAAAIPDIKTPHRRRILRLSATAEMAFRLAAQGKTPDERLWPWTKGQVRHFWEATRDRAAGRKQRGEKKEEDPIGDRAKQLLRERGTVTLPVLRFKDLRHLLPTLLAEMGKDRREIQALLGHAPGSKQTDRYITPVGDVRALDEAAEKLGLSGINLRAVGA